jgi:hypothetical protein
MSYCENHLPHLHSLRPASFSTNQPSGIGKIYEQERPSKTHLAIALGYLATQKGYNSRFFTAQRTWC